MRSPFSPFPVPPRCRTAEDNPLTVSVCVFDAYGTLFDVASAVRRAAERESGGRLADIWPSIASNWRLKQLQYTWLRAVTGAHTDFWTVTRDSLDWALEAAGLDGDQTLRAQLLALYRELDAYPEVKSMLSALRGKGIDAAILSNGSPAMLEDAVRTAGIAKLLADVISVEDVGVFKPHSSVYNLVLRRFSCEPQNVMFVSSNGWDAAAASGFGFRTVWVNRNAEPVERLPWRPQRQLSDLKDIPLLIGKLT